VSWNDAMDFCRKLSEKEGKTHRLPTEAEWEYACRAGSTCPYAGNGRLDDMGWYGDNNGDKIHPVATKQANAWGLYDMHGNVWEWCQDSDQFCQRLLRGGSWDEPSRFCRSSERWPFTADVRRERIGFRVVMDLE